MTPELGLLLLCARVGRTEEETVIRELLEEGVDWTRFAQKAIDHGLACLAGQSLLRAAPELVPDDILDAFGLLIEQTRRRNRVLFDELSGVIEALGKEGVEAIPFKGAILALEAYGDLGLRMFRDLDILIRDGDLEKTIAVLHRLGYERQGPWSEAQFELIHRLQGQEILFKDGVETAIEPHTRLVPMKLALDIDYEGLWRRAGRRPVNGRSMLTLSPEDDLIVLSIHGGKELWWNIKWVCDVAAFLASHPRLDWTAIAERARAQGCLRMVFLATALARRYFNASLPAEIIAAEESDPLIAVLVARIAARWQSDASLGPPSNKTLSLDRLRLHDGALRRVRYVARTLFLPGPSHVGLLRLPQGLDFAYVPVKLLHDLVALPLWRVYRQGLRQARRLQNALADSALATAFLPASAETKRHRKARAAAQRALTADPDNATAWYNLGQALSGLKHYEEAIACYNKALAIEPEHSNAWKRRTAALQGLGKKVDLPDIAPNSQDPNAWSIHASRLSDSKRFTEAAEASDRALSLDPANVAAARIGIYCRLQSADWRRRDEDKRRTSEGMKTEQRVITPFFHLGMCDSEAENFLAAQLWAKRFQPLMTPLRCNEPYRHGKIRVAYASADFREHVVSDMIVGCFEHHDKTRFETTAISLGPDDGSTMRRRIEAAFDRFVDVQAMTDLQVATMLREMEMDIVIDLNGYTGDTRSGILASRPAPVQVNYLGYPGTMGVPFVDYILADRVVIPEENQIHYSEKVAYLPHTYMPNDRKRQITQKTPSRIKVELPESGFVFACFNNANKLSSEVFDIWMRLLRAVEGSVLWLRSTNAAAASNLRREAKARGVAPERLIFARRLPRTEDHLARLRLADLFLDTLPYNAHATACDALWAGLPVLTCLGNTFPGRVAASLLYAIGLPELVTSSLAQYEELALALARNPERLAAIKAKLMRNRDTEPLFDTARFTRDLEAAYTTMWERNQRGEPPASFAVAG